jgi:uncharacterized protein YoxC
MNRVERNSRIAIWIVAIAVTILMAYVLWLLLTMQQLANDLEKCNQPLDQLEKADYQFCLTKGDK